jgi:predicted acyltransferase
MHRAASRLRRRSGEPIAAVLLAMFPVLLMYKPRAAFIALAIGIVMAYRGRVNGARRAAHRRTSGD